MRSPRFPASSHASQPDIGLGALRMVAEFFQNRAPPLSSPSASQRVPTPSATTVSICFSTSHTSRMISSVRSTGTLISMIADITFSFMMSSRIVPVATSLISDVTGFFFSKLTPALRQRPAHFLDIAEPHTDAGPAEFDGEADFAFLHAAADVVGLHFFGAAAMHAGRFMRHARIGKRPAHNARPNQFIGLECGRGANVGLGIEAQAQHLKHLAHGAHQRRIQVFLAQAVVAGIAFHAFFAIDGGALDRRIDVDRAHRANVGAIAARHAFVRIDLHTSILMLPVWSRQFSGIEAAAIKQKRAGDEER